MRIEINERLVQRNKRISQYLFFLALGVLIGAFFLINAPSPSDEIAALLFFLPIIVLPLGFLFTAFSVRMTNLWLRQPRPEEAIEEGLKGLSNKSVLYHYHHFPARHVLVCPQGVFAIVTRYQDGHYGVKGSEWKAFRSMFGTLLSLFRFDRLGNPTQDAQKAAAHVKAALVPIAPDVDVSPLIIFVDPRARLEIENPDVPVVHANPKSNPNLKDFLRDLNKQRKDKAAMPLTPEQIEAFEDATLR